MEDRAAQLRESVLDTRSQLDDFRQLFDSIQFGGTPTLCKMTAEKLKAWWEEIVEVTGELVGAWPKDPDATQLLADVFYTEVLHSIDCRMSMVFGALERMRHEDTFDTLTYEGVCSSGAVVLEEVCNDLVARTEKFIAEHSLLDEPVMA